MFSKTALSSLVIGALSAYALAVPVARSPTPESEFSWTLPTPSDLDLISIFSVAWSEWGQDIGNYYADQYNSPDSVPGLPHFKRSPETWEDWGTDVGNYYSNQYGSPDDVPGLPQDKRGPSPEPETWAEWGNNIGNYYSNEYSSPDNVPGLPQSKREPETWDQWGQNIGNYYASKYPTPDSVPGLPHFKRDELVANVGRDSVNMHGSLPHRKREPSPEPETWEEWGTNIGNSYANQYGSPDDVPGLPHYKREPETWEEWGTNVGNYYANQYGSPDNVPGLPHY